MFISEKNFLCKSVSNRRPLCDLVQKYTVDIFKAWYCQQRNHLMLLESLDSWPHASLFCLSLYIWFIIYKEHIDMHGTALLLLYSFSLHCYSKDRERERDGKGRGERLIYVAWACVCLYGYVPSTYKIYNRSDAGSLTSELTCRPECCSSFSSVLIQQQQQQKTIQLFPFQDIL